MTAYVLEQQRRREEEEARQAAAAAAFNANQRAMDAAGLAAITQTTAYAPEYNEKKKTARQRKWQFQTSIPNISTSSNQNRDPLISRKGIRQMNATKQTIGVRLEKKIKVYHQRLSDDQPPPDAVIIPPFTTEQYVAVKNWNIATQVGTYAITAGAGAGIGAAIGSRFGAPGAFVGGVIGAVIGTGWGTYEVSCIASVQDEFEKAYEHGNGITVWRTGWRFNVDGNSNDGTYTEANGPLSALYVAVTTFILTGKIP